MVTAMLDEKYVVYAEAINDLAAFDGDYGSERNDVGFNRFDSALGHSLASLPFNQWTQAQLVQAHRVLNRYKNTQLISLGYTWADMPEIDDQQIVRDSGTGQVGFATVNLDDKTFVLRWGGADPYFKTRVNDARELTGAKYDKVEKAWRIPVTIPNITGIAAMMAKYAQTELPFSESPGFREEVADHIERVESRLRASSAQDASRDELKLHRVTTPDRVRPFQLAGIKFASESKQTIISDDMGLGKTMQSLLTVAENDAFPCLIVCPASLKLNWKREVEMWVKDGHLGAPVIQVAEGTKPKGIATLGGKVDFLIINYDVMNGWKDVLAAHEWKAIICDESHFLKTEKSLRTKAVKHVVDKTQPEYRLMLTGTPILNKPIEIWPVLGLIGGQEQFGGWYKFALRHCGLTNNGFGYTATGATNLGELNTTLRSTGLMIRRLKEDVLTELPDKQWAKVPVPMEPKSLAKAYENAERDLDKFLAEMTGSEEKADIQAAALLRISTLRKISWRAKEKAAKAWIDNFLESDKKLIVFAWHRDAVEAISEHYDAPVIMGGMKKEVVEEGKRRFQEDDDCRVIVCNIAAGGVGHTLTAASDVLFLEYAWNYALMDQAISRAHRIGQRDTVTGWMLSAQQPNQQPTIDDEMIEIIENKEAIVKAAIDGQGDDTISVVKSRLLSLMQGIETDEAIGE